VKPKDKTLTYQQRIDSVCQYIGEHLDEELTLDKLCQIACFSKFHFHRLFSEFMGVCVNQYIIAMRLKRASYQLVYQPEVKIIDIAFNAGFENPESFSRKFKQNFSQTPSQFRRQPLWQAWHSSLVFARKTKRSIKMKVEIVKFEETEVAVKEHRGAPQRLNHSVSEFIHWRKETGYSPVTISKTFGLAYDDPESTVPEKFRFDICGEIDKAVPNNEYGIVNKTIPAGRCAKVRHYGSHDDMGNTIRALYSDWLLQNGEQLRNFPCYFHYVNLFPQVDEHELITDIYLPIE